MKESLLQTVTKGRKSLRCKCYLSEIRFRRGQKDDRHGEEEFALDLGLAGERVAVVSVCGALPAGCSPCEECSASLEPDRKL